MKPVLQRTDSDCLASSIASILELPVEIVPVFPRCRTGNGQRRRTCEWLATIGYTMLDFSMEALAGMAAPIDPIWCIATIFTPGVTWTHATVAILSSKGIDIQFDPEARGFRDPKAQVISISILVKGMNVAAQS